MARARLLKPGFFTNELLAELPFEGRLLFAGLWTLADRDGRLEDRPKRIKAAVFPFDEVDVGELLAALASRGFIERYTGNAMALIQIAKFSDHQTPHTREAASVLPAPVEPSQTACQQLVMSPGDTGKPRKGDASPSPRSPVTGNGSSSVTGNGSESSAVGSDAEPAVLTFPTAGRPDSWALRTAQLREWQGLYDGLDVLAECKKAWAWVQTTGGHQKTAKGMPRFLVNWLSRATDRPRGSDRHETPRARERAVVGGGGGCPHDPPCARQTACIQRTIDEGRKARGQAS